MGQGARGIRDSYAYEFVIKNEILPKHVANKSLITCFDMYFINLWYGVSPKPIRDYKKRIRWCCWEWLDTISFLVNIHGCTIRKRRISWRQLKGETVCFNIFKMPRLKKARVALPPSTLILSFKSRQLGRLPWAVLWRIRLWIPSGCVPLCGQTVHGLKAHVCVRLF